MQLKVRRSQRTGGVLGTTAIFAIEARAEFLPQELADINKYKLGKQIVYNSKTFDKHQEALKKTKGGHVGDSAFGLAGDAMAIGKNVFHAVAAKMSLVITIDSLQRGQRIECKDLSEVMEAEEALDAACRSVRSYLAIAATFDGREILSDYSTEEPTITIGQAPAPGSLPREPVKEVARLEAPETSEGETSGTPRPALPPPDPDYDDQPQPNPAIERLTYWFNGLTGAQKVGVIIGGLFALYILAQFL